MAPCLAPTSVTLCRCLALADGQALYAATNHGLVLRMKLQPQPAGAETVLSSGQVIHQCPGSCQFSALVASSHPTAGRDSRACCAAQGPDRLCVEACRQLSLAETGEQQAPLQRLARAEHGSCLQDKEICSLSPALS